jgi:hypothetical protein
MKKCLLNVVHHILLNSGLRIPEREICFAITAYPVLVRQTFAHFGICENGAR